MSAQTLNAFGCEGGDVAGFNLVTASSEPVHQGTVCNGGTTCQAFAIDRRLGDYFSNETDQNGNIVVAVSDTRQGGPVSLPLRIRQVSGPTIVGDAGPRASEDPADPADPGPSEDPPEGGVAGDMTRRDAGCEEAASSARPTGADRVSRLNQADPVALGVAVSSACTPSATTAVIARSDVFADALAATGLAAEVDAPVLLTPTDTLDDRVAQELARLGVQDVILAGGEAAISGGVEQQLRDRGYGVTRLGGPERFSTARLISQEILSRGGPVNSAIVALGVRPDGSDPWPDALTAGVLSGQSRAPVFLVTPDQIPGPTLDGIQDLLGGSGNVTISGGTSAISQQVAIELANAGYSVSRLAGSDRYGTSAAVLQRARGAGAGLDVVILASGETFASALVSGAAALQAGGVMLLVQPDDLDNGSSTRQFLESNADMIAQVVIAGDDQAISTQVEQQVRQILTE